LNSPQGLTFDKKGNLFIADTENNCIRRVDARTQIITTVAGAGAEGYSGDGGPALAAKLAEPSGLAFDKAGNLYIADRTNNVIRVIKQPVK
jgi:sugar lactone lactonase YvrE